MTNDLAGRSAPLGFAISYMCWWKCALAASFSSVYISIERLPRVLPGSLILRKEAQTVHDLGASLVGLRLIADAVHGSHEAPQVAARDAVLVLLLDRAPRQAPLLAPTALKSRLGPLVEA